MSLPLLLTIESNQTPRLLKEYRQLFPADKVAIGVLQACGPDDAGEYPT